MWIEPHEMSVWAMYNCLMNKADEKEMLEIMTPRDRKNYKKIKGKKLRVCFDFRGTPHYCTECFYNKVKGEYECVMSDQKPPRRP